MTSTCAGCHSTVYPLERTVLGDHTFHKGCAKCAECGSNLTISSFASAGERLLCKVHYMELFKTAGGKYPTTADVKPAAAPLPKPSLADFLAKESKPAPAPMRSSSSSSSSAATAPPPPPLNNLTPAQRLALFTNQAIAQAEKGGKQPGIEAPKPVVVATVAAPAAVKEAPKTLPFMQAPPATPTKAVVEEPAVGAVVKPAATIQPTPVKPVELPRGTRSTAVTDDKPDAAALFKEKVAQFKSAHPASDVTELAQARARIQALEEEVAVLRARLEQSDAGKEALVMHIVALEKRENVHGAHNKPAASPASPEKALAHAKSLLDKGSISKAQYKAAYKAYQESRMLVGQTSS